MWKIYPMYWGRGEGSSSWRKLSVVRSTVSRALRAWRSVKCLKTGARSFHQKQQPLYSPQVQQLDFFFFFQYKKPPFTKLPSCTRLNQTWAKLGLAKFQPSAGGMLKSRKLWQSWVAEKLLELIYCGHGDRQQPLSSDGKTQKHLQNRLEK